MVFIFIKDMVNPSAGVIISDGGGVTVDTLPVVPTSDSECVVGIALKD